MNTPARLPSWYGVAASRWTERYEFIAPTLHVPHRRTGSAPTLPQTRSDWPIEVWKTDQGVLIEYRLARRLIVVAGIVLANLVVVYMCVRSFVPSLPPPPFLKWVSTLLGHLPTWANVTLGCVLLGVGLYTLIWFALASAIGRESIEISSSAVVLRQRAGPWRMFEYVFDLRGVANFRLARTEYQRRVSEMPALSIAHEPYWEEHGTIAFDFLNRPILLAEKVPLEAAERILSEVLRNHPELASDDPWSGHVVGRRQG